MKKWLALLCFLIAPAVSLAATGPLVNASTLTLTAGATWQALFPANSNRSTIWVENPCSATTQGIAAAESLFIAFKSTIPTTTAGAFELAPCGSLTMLGTNNYVSTQAVWVYATTISHAFIASQTQ